jgi:hypothetical protein
MRNESYAAKLECDKAGMLESLKPEPAGDVQPSSVLAPSMRVCEEIVSEKCAWR